jgi:hypothetical protein
LEKKDFSALFFPPENMNKLGKLTKKVKESFSNFQESACNCIFSLFLPQIPEKTGK